MAQCKCGSFAVNDDPQLKLCDRCWRDATIADLRNRLQMLIDNGVVINLGPGKVVVCDLKYWNQATK